ARGRDGRRPPGGLAAPAGHAFPFRTGATLGRAVSVAARRTLPTLAVVARRSAWPAAAARVAESLGARRIVMQRPAPRARTALAIAPGMATTLPWLAPTAPDSNGHAPTASA